MDELYKEIGKIYCENLRLVEEYRKLLELFQRVKNQEVPIETVNIDLKGLTWGIVLDGNELKV